MSVTTFTLDNGLRVVHRYDGTTAMVALNILYDTGSRDEPDTRTGMAHLLEHLMFAGSQHVDDYDAAMERAGGVNNAWTSEDFTNYWDVAPAVNAETLFWLESDRMGYLTLTQEALDIQRSVVIEEFKQTSLNQPYGDMSHFLRPMLYDRHPYRQPVIGRSVEQLEQITLDDLQRFYNERYAPGNAVLTVSGALPLDDTRRLADKWFGTLPARHTAPRRLLDERGTGMQRRLTVTGPVPQALVSYAVPMAGYGEPGYVEADLLTDILASGRSSRMYRQLVMPGTLFSDADAVISGSEHPGFLMLYGRLLHDTDEAVEQGLQALHAQAEAIVQHGVEQRELTRALNRFLTRRTFNDLSFLKAAEALSLATMHGETPEQITERYRSVTPDDIRRTAATLFASPSGATLIYRPGPVTPIPN